MINLINGECLEEMDKLISQGIKVDAIITDPPYGTTACKWDSVIPFDEHMYFLINKKSVIKNRQDSIIQLCNEGMEYPKAIQYFENNKELGMWYYLNKLIKPNGAIVLFGSEPFSSALRMSNIKNYKYDITWNKVSISNPMLAKKQPLRCIENILLFYKKQPSYNPIMQIGKKWNRGGKKEHKTDTLGGSKLINTGSDKTDLKYPKNLIEFSNANKMKNLHPTQKPVALMEYLIKTYTNENETVLDFTMGSGSTMVACKNLNRNGIGI